MLTRGAIVPHAPLLLDPPDAACRALADASTRVLEEVQRDAEVTIVVSPHGDARAVTSGGAGTLAPFGLDGFSIELEGHDAVAREIAQAWPAPLLDAPLDHGVVGALAGRAGPTVACSLEEVTGPTPPGELGAVLDAAAVLADVLMNLDAPIALVCSAHTAACLTPRAPLTELPEGRLLDNALLDALATDAADILSIPADLWSRTGSCGAGPLTLWAYLFGGTRSLVHAYEHPFGVGYLVATSG